MRIEIAPGVRLFVDVDGFGLVPDGPTMREKPTLLLLHGGPGFDHSGFKPAFSPLADIAQLVTYDHRSHGRSDPRPSAEWTLDTWADDVVRLCDALGIVRPIVLGQSFGGFVAQRYLARHPDHPAKVILSSTSAAFNLERKLPVFERLGGRAARALAETFWRDPTEANTEAYLSEVHPLYNTRPAASPEGRLRAVYRLEILRHFIVNEMHGMDLLPGLAAARCPVLVMAGAEDPVCPPADSQDIFSALPAGRAELQVYPGCGHGAWRDDPESAFAALRRFILA
jgi:pimeloyl-ACP methyl ester carboxylesterase